MALLNYANSISEIEDFLSADSAYLKLAFTGDGHIVTHGIDYTPDFSTVDGTNGGRGLVKGSNNNIKEVLRGTNTWAALSVADLPCIDNLLGAQNNIDTTIPTAKAVIDYIGSFVRTAETMRFMGVINYSTRDGFYYTATGGTTHKGLPNSWNTGDSYRIGIVDSSEKIELAGYTIEPGDMFVCTNTGSGTMSSSSWTVIQTNINGTKLTTINGQPHSFYATDDTPITMFAPITRGERGNVLISIGDNTPKWGSLFNNDGNLHINYIEGTEGTEGQQVSIFNIPIIASKTQKQLYSGASINFLSDNDEQFFSYDGSTKLTAYLLPATIDVLGGVKIGKESDGRYGTLGDTTGPTVSIDDKGIIYLTKENIEFALGYIPSNVHNIVNENDLGYAPQIQDGGPIGADYLVLASDAEGNPNWNSLPITAFKDSWRDIQVNDDSIDNTISDDGYSIPKPLNFKPSANVCVVKTDQEDCVELSFDLTWYNINSDTYELTR